ncbi:sugar ABC transporter substrate-binding protein [Chloroflexi bacterium TSY]|nr:sugar ABC transporter substrate-binding protein [Chloroflexi bacterium TSY]
MGRRHFLQLAGAASGITLLAACQPTVAPTGSDVSADDSPATEGIQLEYLGYDPDEVHAEAFGKFKDIAPDVDLLISPTIGSWPEMLAKINARIAAGDPPDIAIVATYGPPRIWSKKDILLDLQPLLDADPDYADDPVSPALLQLYRVEGKLYGLPKDYVTHAVIYNKGLFDEAGVDYPEDGWTWADCLEKAQALTSGEGQQKVYGWMTQTGPWANEHWMWANEGPGYFDRWHWDLTTPTANDPKNIEALQWLVDTILSSEVSPSPEQLATEDASSRQLSGRIAMWASHTIDTVNLLKNTDKIDWHVVRNPLATEGGPKTTMMWTSGFGIVADTEYPDEAFAFLKHMSIGEGALVLGTTGFSIPAGRPEGFVTEEMASRGGDVFVDAAFNSDLAANDSLGVNHNELLGTAVIPNLEAAFIGQMTAEEALNEIQLLMEEILADADEGQF